MYFSETRGGDTTRRGLPVRKRVITRLRLINNNHPRLGPRDKARTLSRDPAKAVVCNYVCLQKWRSGRANVNTYLSQLKCRLVLKTSAIACTPPDLPLIN